MSNVYVVNVSGGLSSFEAWRRTAEQFGKENVMPVFADVKGDPSRDAHAAPAGSNWDGEDDDTYRFLDDIEGFMGQKIHRLYHPEGLGVWGVIFRERAITIATPSGLRFAPCTKLLKQETLDAYFHDLVDSNPDKKFYQVIGLKYDEMERVEKYKTRVNPDAIFPLLERPYGTNGFITNILRDAGIEPPRMYAAGFAHGNCGGQCIKAGQANWKLLLQFNRGRYLYSEEQEAMFIRDINPKASILRDRRGGVTKPLPLAQFRAEIESKALEADENDWGTCGCFAGGYQVMET